MASIVKVTAPDGTPVAPSDEPGLVAYWVRRGYVVEYDVADGVPGEAVNEVTGEVTPAGEPLPVLEQDGGDPLPDVDPKPVTRRRKTA
ncbi:hypothetical protein [Xylanimonas ulmi]|uniref:Uncharacterized protein n=1 Tax=Xylanimonas ulmi TaxID=228973 RepID=A0A4Q7M301_9MICO|nr:hypothetical protein [Xylanibacterium ulmi]RZS61681.1 hypothetical protein EV386_1991 [Xylanibacterium ulmi]